MQEAPFKAWLEQGRKSGTVASRLANCMRVETFEGDLDTLYDADRLDDLIDRLNYSREDARYERSPSHKVRINGDIYNGSATLKSAVGLYRDFRNAGGRTAASTGAPVKRRMLERQTRRPATDWPVWPQPNGEDVLDLARTMAPFVRFLDPGIVGAVVDDNRRRGAEWSSRLEALGIDSGIYLWEGSPCAFPGVRRYAGGKERELFRQPRPAPDALALDDNDYPKHLWAFVLTGRPFRKQGPVGYQLAHLFDHQKHGNRWRDELDLPPDAGEPAPLYGLFTSAANTVYAPGAFLRPTDHSPKLRSLIQRRALQLYGDMSRVVPPPLTVRPCDERKWDLGNFRWNAPVGGADRVLGFLEFRRERIGQLLDELSAAR